VIIRLFKGSTGIQFVILMITLVLLWIPAIHSGRPMPLPELITPAYGFMYHLLSDLPAWYTLIAMMLLLGEALLLNKLLSDFSITPKNSYLTAFVYIVLMSCLTDYLTLHPVLFVNILIIIMLRMIFIANQKEDSLKEIFAAGILTALCSLFVFKSAGLFVGIWIFLFILRVYSWRQWAVNLIGFVSVYLYVFTWYLFTDKTVEKLQLYRSVFQSMKLVRSAPHFSVYEYILFAIILFLLLISAVNFFYSVGEKLINIRRISLVLLWLLIISVISTVCYISNLRFDFAYILLPLSAMVAMYFTTIKRSLFAEIVLLILFISIVLCRV
jgi:hypothetical protein